MILSVYLFDKCGDHVRNAIMGCRMLAFFEKLKAHFIEDTIKAMVYLIQPITAAILCPINGVIVAITAVTQDTIDTFKACPDPAGFEPYDFQKVFVVSVEKALYFLLLTGKIVEVAEAYLIRSAEGVAVGIVTELESLTIRRKIKLMIRHDKPSSS